MQSYEQLLINNQYKSEAFHYLKTFKLDINSKYIERFSSESDIVSQTRDSQHTLALQNQYSDLKSMKLMKFYRLERLDEIDKKKIKIMKKVERIQSFRKRKRTLIGSPDKEDDNIRIMRSNTILNQYLTRPNNQQVFPSPQPTPGTNNLSTIIYEQDSNLKSRQSSIRNCIAPQSTSSLHFQTNLLNELITATIGLKLPLRRPNNEFVELWEDVNKNMDEETEETESLPTQNAQTGGLNVFSSQQQSQPVFQKEQELEDINIRDFLQVQNRINAKIVGLDNEQQLLTFDNDQKLIDILKKDQELGAMKIMNWSGSDIVHVKGNTQKTHINKILFALFTMNQDIFIWMNGIKEKIHTGQKYLARFMRSNFMENFLLISVMLNTCVLAMDGLFTSDDSVKLLGKFNLVFTIIFIVEMGLKIMGFGIKGYAGDKMNLFDALIVLLSIVELVMPSSDTSTEDEETQTKGSAVSAFRTVRIFRIFRALRVLRVTRLLRALAFMRVIISVIGKTLSSFIYIAFLLFLFIFIYSLLGMQMYGGNFNFEENTNRSNFDSFFNSFISVFQLLTLENWQDLLFSAMRCSTLTFFDMFYFLTWIFIGNYIFLNLFLAILLQGFTEESTDDDDDDDTVIMKIEQELLMDKEYVEKKIKEKKEEKKKEQENDPVFYYNHLLLLKEAKTESMRKSIVNNNSSSLTPSSNQKQDEEEEFNLLYRPRKEAPKKSLYEGIRCEESLYLFPKSNIIRIQLYKLYVHPLFDNFILFAIILSSMKLVFDTYIDQDGTDSLSQKLTSISENIDIVFNIIFAMESLVKIIAMGFFMDKGSYLTEPWNVLDFFIVVSSLIDMNLESVDIPAIKVLRLLRTLRPLRFISHNINLKIVVTSLLESVGAIINVLIVLILIWLMFAILAINLLKEKMSYCSGVDNIYGIGYSECADLGFQWKAYDTNFDNIYNAMITLYVVSSLEGWPNIMFLAIDANEKAEGPKRDGNIYIAFYFIGFILVGSFFLINLFVGVIFFHFQKAQNAEAQGSSEINSELFLNEHQKNWISLMKLITKSKPDFICFRRPRNKIRFKIFKLVQNEKFDYFILVVIMLNILTMALSFEGMTAEYEKGLTYANLVFTVVFIMEAFLKVLGLGFTGYWFNGWNRFDFFVVLTSIVDLLMDIMGASFMTFLRVGPQLARVFRVLRITRLFKLVKSFEEMQNLLQTLILSLPSLVNVGALLLLVFFIYAVLGVFMFQDIRKGDRIDEWNNFSNFGYGMMLLFRAATGEDWFKIMYDCTRTQDCYEADGHSNCGSVFGFFYFITFILICSFIMLNLFVLVIIDQFEKYYGQEINPIDIFKENLYWFRVVWSKYSRESRGYKMPAKELFDFFYEVKPPLGFDKERGHHRKFVAREIMSMNLFGDQQGNVYFNELLFGTVKRIFGQYVIESARPTTSPNLTTKKAAVVNPMILVLFTAMTIKAWISYTRKFKEQFAIEDDLKQKMLVDDNAFQIQYLDIDQDADEDEEEEEEQEEEYDEDIQEEEIEDDDGEILQEVDEEDEEDQMAFRQRSKHGSLRHSNINTPKAKSSSLASKSAVNNQKLGLFARIKQKLASIFLRKKVFQAPVFQDDVFVRKVLSHEDENSLQSNRELLNFRRANQLSEQNASAIDLEELKKEQQQQEQGNKKQQ